MTYRERRLARAERLEEWSAKRAAKSAAAFGAAEQLADSIPLGQPILVGHHSERRARRDQDRIHSGMAAGVEHGRKAERMSASAEEIRRQADRAIYSDDPDAPERLRERLAELEQKRDAMKAANDVYRKAHRAELAAMTPYQRSQAVPWPTYALTNLSGNLSRLRKRLHDVENPRPTWFQASRRDPDVCYRCDYRLGDHAPHATVPSLLMCPTELGR